MVVEAENTDIEQLRRIGNLLEDNGYTNHPSHTLNEDSSVIHIETRRKIYLYLPKYMGTTSVGGGKFYSKGLWGSFLQTLVDLLYNRKISEEEISEDFYNDENDNPDEDVLITDEDTDTYKIRKGLKDSSIVLSKQDSLVRNLYKDVSDLCLKYSTTRTYTELFDKIIDAVKNQQQ